MTGVLVLGDCVWFGIVCVSVSCGCDLVLGDWVCFWCRLTDFCECVWCRVICFCYVFGAMLTVYFCFGTFSCGFFPPLFS